jgi:uncharacterized protein (TIGR02001 family)
MHEVVRLLASGMVLSSALMCAPSICAAADLWGGSVALTNHYIVRGISRSYDHAALQLELHYLNDTGLVAGVFASNTHIDPGETSQVELDGFAGFAWTTGGEWRGRALVNHYAYVRDRHGSGYDYDELDLDAAYRGWLNIGLVYSPNAPRYTVYRGLIGVSSSSAEISVRQPVWRRLSATAGVGYSRLSGPDPAGYAYWSAGVAWELAPVTLALSYVDTTAGAKALFYDAAARGLWGATAIWRF